LLLIRRILLVGRLVANRSVEGPPRSTASRRLLLAMSLPNGSMRANAPGRGHLGAIMSYKNLTLSRRGRVVTIALDRPASLNAFDATLHTEFAQAIAEVAQEAQSDVVVLTGNGRAFSAGGDLAWQQRAADNPASFEVTVREAKQIVFGMID